MIKSLIIVTVLILIVGYLIIDILPAVVVEAIYRRRRSR